MSIEVNNYNPSLHNQLMDYMISEFPFRNKKYLEWWLSNIKDASLDCWDKCIIIKENEKIIGCTTVNELIVNADNTNIVFFSTSNTIVSPSQRGKGISKIIYKVRNDYKNWIGLGITDIAWKILPKYVENFTPIRPINVYIGLNRQIVIQLLKKQFSISNSSLTDFSFPRNLRIDKEDEVQKIEKVSEIDFPINGHWTEDDVELVRDGVFFQKRFFDIYCAQRYGIYQYISKNRCIGYVIIRRTQYKGLEMVSLVDYRFHSRKDELKAFKVALKIANINRIGLVIALSSRKYGFSFSPFMIKMKKKLNCAIGMKDKVNQFNNMLITSADSDLDFVYYK